MHEIGACYPNFQRKNANQGWNQGTEWRKHGLNWRERKTKRESYVLQYKHAKVGELKTNLEH